LNQDSSIGATVLGEPGAIGVVVGDYQFDPAPPPGTRADYKNVLPVRWLATGLHFDILNLNGGKRLTQKTIYPLDRFTWPDLVTAAEADGIQLEGLDAGSSATEQVKPHVLIIDEINRGNVSRVFGELITLIEPSKRIGTPEELRLTLPYSKKKFGVPSNLHIIGTMNTADRSLTGLDIALRRRFVFRELSPRPEMLDGLVIDGLKIGDLLRSLNHRIEALLDRDHCLGHAYFLALKDACTLDRLRALFEDSVLPLLQEYFFDDAERIGWILNDPNAPAGVQRFLLPAQEGPYSLADLFGDEAAARLQDNRWSINPRALASIDSYRNIVARAVG